MVLFIVYNPVPCFVAALAAYYAFVAQRCKESFGLSLAEAQCLGGLCCSGAWVAGYKCQQPSLGFGYTDIYTDILAVYFVTLMRIM